MVVRHGRRRRTRHRADDAGGQPRDAAVAEMSQSGTSTRTGHSASARASGAGRRNPHLFDYLAILYRYRHLAGAVFVLVATVVMVNTFTTPPMYRAQARILIEDERSAQTDFREAYAYYEDPEP